MRGVVVMGGGVGYRTALSRGVGAQGVNPEMESQATESLL